MSGAAAPRRRAAVRRDAGSFLHIGENVRPAAEAAQHILFEDQTEIRPSALDRQQPGITAWEQEKFHMR